MRNRRTWTTAAAAGGTLAAVMLVWGGPLDPPSGPVAPTMKTLAEVEPRTPISSLPFTISQPGSYYVTGNLTGAVMQHGITIAASDVTLDLKGFTLTGASGSLNGIFVNGAQTNTVIMNGAAQGWAQNGLNASAAEKTRVAAFKARNNTLAGIVVGEQSTITYSSATENGGDGITATQSCKFDNDDTGKNLGKGITAGNGATVIACHTSSNGAEGMSLGDGATVNACNANSNAGHGIAVGPGAAVLACVSTSNGGDGIHCSASGRVADCTVRVNSGDGIEANTDCYISGNACDGNGAGMAVAAGIHVLGSDSRIDANNLTDNDIGIDANPVSGCLIIRNSASGNTANFDIATTNVIGQIITMTSGIIPATASAWSNFEF